MKKVILFLLFVYNSSFVIGQRAYTTERDISYYEDSLNNKTEYRTKQCKLDLYYPKNKKNFATIIWFHGGGLTGGRKQIPTSLMEKGYAVVGVGYSLYPKVKTPIFIEDAAAATAWVFKNIEEYGGNSKRIFISGHSAGGYLTLMIGLDKHYLNTHNVDADSIAGLIPFSGHTITHFTVRKERGIKKRQPIIDRYAPLFHVRRNASPLLLITGDADKEMLGRYEENAYLWRMMKIAGHKQTKIFELEGFDHGRMVRPAYSLLLKEVAEIVEKQKNKGI